MFYTPEIGMKHVSHFNSQMFEKVKKWNIDNWAAILEMTSLKEGPSRPDFNFCPKCVANIHKRSLDEIIRWYLFSNKMHYGKLWDSLNFDQIVIRYQYHTSWLDKVYTIEPVRLGTIHWHRVVKKWYPLYFYMVWYLPNAAHSLFWPLNAFSRSFRHKITHLKEHSFSGIPVFWMVENP